MKKIYIIVVLLLTGMMAEAQTSVWEGKRRLWSRGEGTEDSPFLIETADNLAFLSYIVNKGVDTRGVYFELTTDIDLNGHVNNARYPRFVIDALNPGDEGSVRSFQIDYRHEVMPGAPLAVHTLVEDGRVLSKGVREDGNVAFACAIELT